ncbi:MAG: bifunctional riboflavin kinase/FAD synthetase [Deltaproteobacteria bacterium]|nr:bifunctional riboflavin kinase/FAD synthetase [Deltaproteobacteria bacterium]
MKIVRNLEDPLLPLKNTVVTIGNFDGVHLGHREIFRRLVAAARRLGGSSAVLTFVPHPMEVLAPHRAPRLINTYAEKEALIEASHIDFLVCAPFTAETARMPAPRFVEEVLVGKLGLTHLIVGYDYRFGKGREGDIPYLAEKGKEMGFGVEILKPISKGGQIYSSTFIRKLIAEGKVAEAIPFLGRNFKLEGWVRPGFRRGRMIGYPTANLIPDPKILPGPGVYAVKVRCRGQIRDGVLNIGYNPTFSQNELSVEVHILDFAETIYGEKVRLFFVDRLRDETHFPSREELRAAIGQDVEQARRILKTSRIIEYREYLEAGDGASGEGNSHERD